MSDSRIEVVPYDPPRIEERAPIAFALIGVLSLPTP